MVKTGKRRDETVKSPSRNADCLYICALGYAVSRAATIVKSTPHDEQTDALGGEQSDSSAPAKHGFWRDGSNGNNQI